MRINQSINKCIIYVYYLFNLISSSFKLNPQDLFRLYAMIFYIYINIFMRYEIMEAK